MNIENYIEGKYREMESDINLEYIDLYQSFSHQKLQELFSTIHHIFVVNYRLMNDRLPTNEHEAHFWADPSRNLLRAIETLTGLQRMLKSTLYAFNIVEYYQEIVTQSLNFLSKSGGSSIPAHMDKVEIYYIQPILVQPQTIKLKSFENKQQYANLRLIGEGSYAQVFTFKDPFYNRKFVLKRAKKDLNAKELERFRQEFEQMKNLSSPYIVDVFHYDSSTNEYIMEFLDYTLDKYYRKNNSQLTSKERKCIAIQILRAFKYIHANELLHRDISPKNILIKVYDDGTKVVKVSDFGLVKTTDSSLTSSNTQFKGYYNDPGLVTEGFKNYNILHETYALTKLMYFVMTGREEDISNIKNLSLKSFVTKGLSVNKENRYQSVDEMIASLKNIELSK